MRKTTDEFIKSANKKHNNKYDYSKTKYIKYNEAIIIVCKIHGEFLQKPNTHLNGHGCQKCTKINKGKRFKQKQLNNQKFIEKANLIHNGFYDYSKVNYTYSYNQVSIICPIHGEFSQEPRNHLSGKGCPECGIIKKTSFPKYLDKKIKTNIYFIKLFNDREEFYKVGITTRKIKKRFSDIGEIYNIEVISKREMDLDIAIKAEEKFIIDFRNYKYVPEHKFDGWTECFKKEIYNIMFPS